MWFLGMVCIALIASMAYVFMLLVMDLVESSNIKTEMSNMHAHTLECKTTRDNTRGNGHDHFVLGGNYGLSRLYQQIMQKFHRMQSKTLYQGCLPDHDDDGYGVVHLSTHVLAHHPSMAKDRTGAAIATNPRRLFWFRSIFLCADGTQYSHLLYLVNYMRIHPSS